MDYEGWSWPCLIYTGFAILSTILFLIALEFIPSPDGTGIPSATAGNNNSSASTSTSASASASASASGVEYEVFLSFSGKDTRDGFTDFLYNDLVDAGIRTFRDVNKLGVGEEIGPELLKAIEESKISIPVFSRSYASSKWCLRELSKMVECHTTMGQKIFPIFYDVEASDVRHQRGSFKQAFLRHKTRFDEKTVQRWKEALRKVGELKGWELKKETNGRQGELVKMVTSKILFELKKNYMVVTDNLVGIDSHVEEMMRLLNAGSNDVHIVGIHGMGGIGKTTIAKVIYNQIFEHFEACSFLVDVRERSQQHKGLIDLQDELCSTILKRKTLNDIANVDEGLNRIKNTVCRKKVFIVLDDVDEKSQFDNLVGNCDWFGSGSRIIITTRNKQVLNLLVVNRTYEPPLMETNHALQLFSKHAFRRDFPQEDYVILSRQVVSTAAGLPLALENIGSFLFGKGKGVWKDTLKKLKKIPEEDVQKKLRISYDALNYEQQQIFLDIACLFIGEDKRLAFYMWDDCEFYPEYGIDVLVLRSLVKIGDDNMLRMHDQLRDLGREIVRHENIKEPGKRSRLWSHGEAFDTLDTLRSMGTQKDEALKVEALCMGSNFRFSNKEFGLLPNLRFLQMDGGDIVGDYKHLLSNLRWLKWRHCPEEFTPTNIHLENLVILDLSLSRIRDNWEAWSQLKMAKRLKVLDLTYCSGLIKTPDLSTFPALERLILRGCPNLVQIDPSIGNLTNLRVLDISWSLITKLPDAVGNLEKLEEMNASRCCKLQGVPNIGRLSSLRILELNFTKIRSLPMSISGLSHLQTLGLLNYGELQSLPELPPSLTSLCVTCEFMETFLSLSSLVNLKELYFFRCHNLVKIPKDIENLSKLETLTLFATQISTLPAEIGALSQLKILEVRSCIYLQCIPGLPSSLLKLCLENCQSLERLPDLSNLKNILELNLSQCSQLMEIRGLGKLELLTSLDVSGCGKLAKLDGLEQLECLRYLNTSRCASLKGLLDLSNMQTIKKLMLCESQKLVEIERLRLLKSWERLDLSCTSLKFEEDTEYLKVFKELKNRCCNINVVQRYEELGYIEMMEIVMWRIKSLKLTYKS